MIMRSISFLCLLLIGTTSALAQKKLEREFRIQQALVPEQAIRFAQTITGSHKLKWYREEGIDQISLEAKVKVEGQRFSIEFDTSGRIQDVELEIQLHQIPENTKLAMISALKEDFTAFKWEKIQIQYQGTEAVLLDYFATKQGDVPPNTRYEVIVHGKQKRISDFYEWVFSESGAVLSKATIISRIADNLEY